MTHVVSLLRSFLSFVSNTVHVISADEEDNRSSLRTVNTHMQYTVYYENFRAEYYE